MQTSRFHELLKTLLNQGVEFVVVGGVAAVLRGAPVTTFDLDVAHSTTPENAARILTALEELDAYYRFQPERRLKPGLSHLVSGGHQLLMTRLGPLDLLGSVGKGWAYRDLESRSEEMDLGGGLRARVLSLEAQIQIKEDLGMEKDLAMLPVLRKTLQERSGRRADQ